MNEHSYTHIDLSYLYEIADNETDFVKEMINDYIDKIPVQFDELCGNVARSDFEQTRFLAHKLKSSFQFMGAQELIQLAYIIEKLSESGDSKTINEKLPEMKNAVKLVLEELHRKLDSLA